LDITTRQCAWLAMPYVLLCPHAVCRHYQLLRIRGNGEVIKREDFMTRKEAAEQARQARLNKKPKRLSSQGKNVEDCPLLQVADSPGM
jgi:hypothetical protein